MPKSTISKEQKVVTAELDHLMYSLLGEYKADIDRKPTA